MCDVLSPDLQAPLAVVEVVLPIRQSQPVLVGVHHVCVGILEIGILIQGEGQGYTEFVRFGHKQGQVRMVREGPDLLEVLAKW